MAIFITAVCRAASRLRVKEVARGQLSIEHPSIVSCAVDAKTTLYVEVGIPARVLSLTYVLTGRQGGSIRWRDRWLGVSGGGEHGRLSRIQLIQLPVVPVNVRRL